jgi:hypothetical protein
MIDPIIGGLVFAAILTSATKTGRAAAKNAAKSGHAATGWRTPGKALEHHSGRAGAAGGRIFAAGLRKTRHATGKAGTAAENAASKRWDARTGTPPAPMIRWLRDKQPGTPGDPGATASKPDATTSTAPPSFGAKKASPGGGDGGAPATGLTPEEIAAIKAPYVADLAGDGVRPEEIMVKPDGEIWLDRRKTTWWAKPTLIGNWTPPGRPGPGRPAPDTTTATAPRRGGDRSTSTVSRFAINLEAPTSDAEFLASCIDLGDALRGMAEEIGEWAEGIASLGLPSSVTTPLNAVAEGITEAAAGAARAASSFADEFEDAREVAARGMKFTGRDAA